MVDTVIMVVDVRFTVSLDVSTIIKSVFIWFNRCSMADLKYLLILIIFEEVFDVLPHVFQSLAHAELFFVYLIFL